MYLRQTTTGPLVNEDVIAALNVLRDLKANGRQPGWSKDEQGQIRSHPEVSLNAITFRIEKSGDSSIYHYALTRASKGDAWTLQRAWRTDQNDRTLQEYPVP
jgi:hypothetical protein